MEGEDFALTTNDTEEAEARWLIAFGRVIDEAKEELTAKLANGEKFEDFLGTYEDWLQMLWERSQKPKNRKLIEDYGKSERLIKSENEKSRQ